MRGFAIAIVVLLALVSGCAEPIPESERRDESSAAAPRDAEPLFRIDGQAVQLNEAGEDGTVSVLTSVTGDLDEDGHEDRAVVLRLDSRGTGIFYYLNAFLWENDGGWRLAGEEFLGDRIRFDFMEIYGDGSVAPGTDVPVHPDDHGTLVVAYFTHGDQPLSEPPQLYLTRRWRVGDGNLVFQENF
jgi:hypothetical protein